MPPCRQSAAAPALFSPTANLTRRRRRRLRPLTARACLDFVLDGQFMRGSPAAADHSLLLPASSRALSPVSRGLVARSAALRCMWWWWVASQEPGAGRFDGSLQSLAVAVAFSPSPASLEPRSSTAVLAYEAASERPDRDARDPVSLCHASRRLAHWCPAFLCARPLIRPIP